MATKSLVISYLLTFGVFLIIDMLWLGVVAKNIYQKFLGDFITNDVNWVAAFTFYILFVIGVFIFIVTPAVNKDSVYYAIYMGALFGFFTYGTYDLTNLATLKNWPLSIVIIDMVWGTILSSIVSVAGFYFLRWMES